jgi:hypothetical protein
MEAMSTGSKEKMAEEPAMAFEELVCRLTNRERWLARLEITLGEASDLLFQMGDVAGSGALRERILALRTEVGLIRNGSTPPMAVIYPFRIESTDPAREIERR